jgi:short-subunit dehydrogenase
VLVNNAGTMLVGPISTLQASDFETALHDNFLSAVYATLAVLPSMRRRRSGRIINIASIGGKISVPHLLPYSASKFALVGFSEGLRAELAGIGIKVTTVCPGLMRTGSARQAMFKGRQRSEFDWFVTSASAPGISMSAERAGRTILAAAARGESEIVLLLPVKAATLLHGLAPGFTLDLLGLAGRLLPDATGETSDAVSGKHLEGTVPKWRTLLSDRAAQRNNEVAASD